VGGKNYEFMVWPIIIGAAYADKDQLDQAIGVCTKALDLNPNCGEATAMVEEYITSMVNTAILFGFRFGLGLVAIIGVIIAIVHK